MTIGCRIFRCGLLCLGGILGEHCAAASGKPAWCPSAQAAADTLPGEVLSYHKKGRVSERCRQFEGARVLYYPSGRVQSEMSFRAGRAVHTTGTGAWHGK